MQGVSRVPAIFLELRLSDRPFVAGGLEALQQDAPLGWLPIAGGLAIWAVLGYLYWITARTNRRKEEVQRQPYVPPSPQRGGFGKGSS